MQRSRGPPRHDLPSRPRSLSNTYREQHLTTMPWLRLTALPPEIILHICRLLHEPEAWDALQIQPHLAALALTCRCLSKPALDVLWDTIGSLVPLVAYTLPKDLCTIVFMPNGVKIQERAIRYHVVSAASRRCQRILRGIV